MGSSTMTQGQLVEAPAASEQTRAEELYARICVFRRGLPNDELLACMLATHWAGGAALPHHLGLSEEAYRSMLNRHFSGLEDMSAPAPVTTQVAPAGTNAAVAEELREAERQELRTLLMFHRAGQDRSEAWMADIVAAACMGGNHLWQDLGLWSRRDLSALMTNNFPALAQKNDRDMKWKKFLYKQLCIQEGIYTCRSPSCEVCADYQVCFGPEE